MIELLASALLFSWNHDGLDVDGGELHAHKLGFQIEYSLNSGTPVYIDLDPGLFKSATETMSHQADVTVLCDDTVISRIRAVHGKTVSLWSAQTSVSAKECPAPTAPKEMTITQQ